LIFGNDCRKLGGVVKVDDWHVSWPANEMRYKDVYCRWNIAGVATLCDDNAILLANHCIRSLKHCPHYNASISAMINKRNSLMFLCLTCCSHCVLDRTQDKTQA
jgi:hypothetical protein